MSDRLSPLQDGLLDLDGFTDLGHYRLFGRAFLEFVEAEDPTLIYSPSDERYRFYQYGEAYGREITRPLNFDLWIEDPARFASAFDRVVSVLEDTAGAGRLSEAVRSYAASGEMRRVLYTAQQAAGCVSDSLGNANRARKRVGQVFERLILLLVQQAGVDCEARTITLPLPGDGGHTMKYELDLVFSRKGAVLTGEAPLLPGEVVGSVKTTSKDRIDKVFLDKVMMSKLLGRDVPVVGVFLHDVQRARRKNSIFGVASTFKRNHFVGYSLALTALDGVYYVDPRPEMVTDDQLSSRISGIERFLLDDLWRLVGYPPHPVWLPGGGVVPHECATAPPYKPRHPRAGRGYRGAPLTAPPPMPDRAAPVAGRFGTFAGVFTPNVLTILGIILFLRTGWVVGQAGLVGALVIIGLANAISLLTGLSLSSIATSMKVKAGGNYFLISRSLGLEIGGAIGIPLYLSQAISVAFYVIGFVEAMEAVPFLAAFDARVFATAVALGFVVIAYVGADFALKIQFGILAILVAALVSFFAGGWGSVGAPTTGAAYTDGVSFWVVFAVFFPAVTGIEVGISLSGDLKDPSESIPRGTIASILVTAVVYVAAAVWFATHLTPAELIGNTSAMSEIAAVPALILAGVAASTLSSALGSVLAAPRTLQAVAGDRVVPRWMAGQMGSPTEPRAAVLLTGAVAVAVIWAGDIDAVAPVITMFFLNTYGMVNLVAAIEKLVGNPSFRPTFAVPALVPALGALGCYGAMFLINAPATVAAIVVTYGIYFYLRRRGTVEAWGDVRSGVWTSLARFALLKLERGQTAGDARNWRPNLMVFTGQPHNREHLVALSDWLSLGRGVVTFSQLITGEVEDRGRPALREKAQNRIREYIREHRMAAFAEAQIVSDFRSGAVAVVQAHGIGRLESNTIVMGWSRTAGGREMQMSLLRDFADLHKSALFLHVDAERAFGERRTVHVWWGGRGGNGDLMLLLAHLAVRHRAWDGATLRVLRMVGRAEAVEGVRADAEALLEAVHVEAEVEVVLREDPDRPFTDVLAEHSRGADLTVLGMQRPDGEGYGEGLNELVAAAGTTLLVHNGHPDEATLESE